jgi:hypothetical protein
MSYKDHLAFGFHIPPIGHFLSPCLKKGEEMEARGVWSLRIDNDI